MKPHLLRTEELDYDLPPELIATRPVEPRDSARLLVTWRSKPEIQHRHVRDLPQYLEAGDALVFNKTAVAPARFVGRRTDTGGRVEGLYLNDESIGSAPDVFWRMMLKAGGRLQPHQQIEWLNQRAEPSGVAVELLNRDGGEWLVRLVGAASTQRAFEAAGWTPLPPYIRHARGQTIDDQLDRQWYQTVYADPTLNRSVAAPTAGLHFTPELLAAIERQGVERIDVTLHVGPGTFKPVMTSTLAEHQMHMEAYEVSAAALAAIRRVRHRNGRLIAVGTTTVRTLESLPASWPGEDEICGPIAGMTDLMIAPLHDFRVVDGMLTNFHLPRSTLMALVAAMMGEGGLERLKMVYREAIERRYRFYSYGDAMLVLP